MARIETESARAGRDRVRSVGTRLSLLSPKRAMTALAAVAALSAGVGACGGDASSSESAAVEARIERERADAAENARQEAELKDLRRKVREIDGDRGGSPSRPPKETSGATPAAAPAEPAGDRKVFHVGAGNVSCELATTGATCSVASIGETFVLANGVPATRRSGAVLPRGSGTRVAYGSAITAGGITCTVPPENVPRGITCEDGSGHGFEASKVPARQRVF